LNKPEHLVPIDDHAAFLEGAARAEWKPEHITQRAQLTEIFAREAPLDVDLGCGEGSFLIEMARRHPERNYLATERMLARVHRVSRLISRNHLENVRIVQLESKYVISRLLPKECVSTAYISFPDPWPKRHHQVRRLIQDDFMVALHELLVPGGEVRLKTDDLPYFKWMEKVLARAQGFERIEWVEEPDYPLTNFEEHFLSQGLPIHRARLRKV
jgi:tRNA (guanine-N7-)-methyltransferase